MKKDSVIRVYDRKAKEDVDLELCTEKNKQSKKTLWYIRDPRTKKIINKDSGFESKPTPIQILKFF